MREFSSSFGAEVAVVSRGARFETCGNQVTKTFRMELPTAKFHDCLRDFAPDICIHAAGKASVPESIRDPQADFLSHVIVTESVLEAVRKVAPQCTILYLSSAAVYGQPQQLPISEDSPCHPMSPYGFHKYMAELLLQKASALHGMTTIAARIFSAFGPGLERQVIWEMCRQAVTSKKIQLAGTGNEARDFIHASDVASAIASLAARPRHQHSVFNIASGVSCRIKDVAQSISKACGGIPIEFQGKSLAGDPSDWSADVKRLRSEGFTARVPLDRGISEVLEYARAQNRG